MNISAQDYQWKKEQTAGSGMRTALGGTALSSKRIIGKLMEGMLPSGLVLRGLN